ncbi:SDR family NAD(P)-dependent oxidoreductase [Mangrovicoccus algicola]|uniref:SDR family oxidoreductase n=1 Tax=Mangrovicoccus algicola TaxID=2771008 RepID=A0A8J6Z6N2_9RHOB|nr:SDR family oxidoreductase [Mangrovicoccus algicola]MBE3638829.1 SDR family oxidoreductase [Mangrovicoccus algicola]
MKLGIDGKLAVVTGAAGGIGRATAQVLAEEGVRLFLTDTDADQLQAAAAEIGPAVGGTRAADLSDPGAIADLAGRIAEAGGADILVHMAGVTGAKGDPLEMRDEDWAECWTVNFMSAVRMSRALVPAMAAKGWGRVVFTVSENAVQPYPDEAVYNASKAALLSYTKALSLPYGPKGVLVNAVMPAFIETPMTDGMMEKRAEAMGVSREEAIESFLAEERPYLSLRRRGRPEEVASVAALLCSDRAGFTNGSAWRADGGAVASIDT